MVIELLLDLVSSVLHAGFALFDFPSLPVNVDNILHDLQFTQAMANGVSIVAAYTHFTFLLGLFVFCCAVEIAENVYKSLRWILRKIPFLGIE